MNFYADNEAVLSSFGDNTAPTGHKEIWPRPGNQNFANARDRAPVSINEKWDFCQTVAGQNR